MAASDDNLRRIKLNGARFAGGRLPIDSLVELERYQELTRILARSEWREAHPGEQLPKDFDEEVSLTIDRIKPGSAEVYLLFEQHAAYAEYQTQAQDALDGVIAATYSGAAMPSLPPAVEEDLRDRLLDFGNTLEPTQSIEIYPDSGATVPVKIDTVKRQELIDRHFAETFLVDPSLTAGSLLEKHSETLVGQITEVDAKRGTFRFESARYGTLIAHYDRESDLIQNIRAVLDAPAEAPVLRVSGDLQWRNASPWRFTSIELVEFFAAGSEPWASRLVEIASLPRGWGDEGLGEVIAFDALDAANKLMDRLSKASATLPGIFATEEGGVILEWAMIGRVRSIEATPDGAFELFEKVAGSAGALRVTRTLDEATSFAKGELR